MPKRKFIDQRLVTEFAEFRALKNKIEKWLDMLREDFLAKFADGFECPTEGPFLVVIQPSSRANINWKQEFFEHLKTDYEAAGSAADVAEQLATVKMVQMEIAAGKTETKTLVPKPNPSWGGKVMSALVKKLDLRTERGF